MFPRRLVILAALTLAAFALGAPAGTSALFVTYHVNSTADPGNGTCDATECTLREAITAANAASSVVIQFELPGCPAHTSSCEIKPASHLPEIEGESTTIDATTQPGYNGDAIVIVDGGAAGSSDGIDVNADFVTISGLHIRNFEGFGIGEIQSTETTFTVSDNFVESNGDEGVAASIAGLGGILDVEGNVIANNHGIGVDGTWQMPHTVTFANNTVTGNTGGGAKLKADTSVSASGNTFSDNTGVGLQVTGGNALISFNRIAGNSGDGVSSATMATAMNNWWGCNAGPTDPDCDTAANANTDPWLVLGVSSSPHSIAIGGQSGITADLTHSSDGTDTSGSGHVTDGTGVLFATDLGTMGPPATGATMNGTSTVALHAGNTPGIAHATATVDNQTVEVEVTINGPATPTPTPTPTAAPGHTQGDLDCSGAIDGRDALRPVRFQAGLALTTPHNCPDLTDFTPQFADVNCDGNIDSGDTVAILKYAAAIRGTPSPPTGCVPIGAALS